MRISDWSSDVCSSDLLLLFLGASLRYAPTMENSDIPAGAPETGSEAVPSRRKMLALGAVGVSAALTIRPAFAQTAVSVMNCEIPVPGATAAGQYIDRAGMRSEEHTSELQSLMRISYAV